jgi:tRNA (adenine22-N1)-methyltransferase
MRLPNPKLSPRMRTFLDYALIDNVLWDVCCDHGYVGIKAMESGSFTEVHFVDQIPHIMERLDKLIHQSKKIKDHKYFLYTLPGEAIINEIHGTMLIAGVGGSTIKNILQGLFLKKNLKAKRLLLSPHMDEKIFVAYIDSEEFKNAYSFKEKILMKEGPRERPLYIFDQV